MLNNQIADVTLNHSLRLLHNQIIIFLVLKTRESLFEKKLSCGFIFFKTVLYTNILNTCTYLFNLMKSFKHEHLFYLHSYMSSQHRLSLQVHRPIWA